jgi:hypothetical protein
MRVAGDLPGFGWEGPVTPTQWGRLHKTRLVGVSRLTFSNAEYLRGSPC